VLVVEFEGYLTDRYDPANRRLLLSRKNFRGRSAAAWAVAIHEAGHALQHRNGAGAYKARMAAIHACRYLAGGTLLLCGIAGIARTLPFKVGGLIVGMVWPACFLANLITLPAEFHASRQALRLADESEPWMDEVKSAMTAAACRDLDALLTTLPALLYSLLPLSQKKPGPAKPRHDPDTH
jgi:Zn-dependent membrane protease YugP